MRIKRADLPEKNELNVFNRMRTERERLAKKFRAEGDEEARKIRSESDKEVQILTGRGAQASRDHPRRGRCAGGRRSSPTPTAATPSSTQFVRTLEAYRNTITEGTTLILSPNSEFFRLLQKSDRK